MQLVCNALIFARFRSQFNFKIGDVLISNWGRFKAAIIVDDYLVINYLHIFITAIVSFYCMAKASFPLNYLLHILHQTTQCLQEFDLSGILILVKYVVFSRPLYADRHTNLFQFHYLAPTLGIPQMNHLRHEEMFKEVHTKYTRTSFFLFSIFLLVLYHNLIFFL